MYLFVFALVIIAALVLFIVYNMRKRYKCDTLQGSGAAFITNINNAVTVRCKDPIQKPFYSLAAAVKACDRNTNCKQVVSVKVGKIFKYQVCATESDNCKEECCTICSCPTNCPASSTGYQIIEPTCSPGQQAPAVMSDPLIASRANYIKNGKSGECVLIKENNKTLQFTSLKEALSKLRTYTNNRNRILKANLKLDADKQQSVPDECTSIAMQRRFGTGKNTFSLCSTLPVLQCTSNQVCRSACPECNLTCESPECNIQTEFTQIATPKPTNLYKYAPGPRPVIFDCPYTYQKLSTPTVMLAPATYQYQTPKYTRTSYIRPSFILTEPVGFQEAFCNTMTSIPKERILDPVFYNLSVPTSSEFTFSSTLNPETNKHEINLKQKLRPLLYANKMDVNARLKWDVITRLVVTNTTHVKDPNNNVDLNIILSKDPISVVCHDKLRYMKTVSFTPPNGLRYLFADNSIALDYNNPNKKFTTWYDSHPKNQSERSRGMIYMLLNEIYDVVQLMFVNVIDNVPFTLTVTLGTLLAEDNYKKIVTIEETIDTREDDEREADEKAGIYLEEATEVGIFIVQPNSSYSLHKDVDKTNKYKPIDSTKGSIFETVKCYNVNK